MQVYENKNRKKWQKIFLIIGILTFFIVIIYLYFSYSSIDISKYENRNDEDFTRLSLIQEEKDFNKSISNLIEENMECVVGVSKIKDSQAAIFLKDGLNKLEIGSGIIVTENGYILTNEHVSGEKFGKCYVTFENGSNFPADVIWSDTNLDLSIIKINVKGLKKASLGDSNNIKIAEKVYAIGNPVGFEFEKTVTSGIISGVNRTIKFEENEKTIYMSSLIQTDTSINPGNSGGPLINLNGEVIGINSVKITSADGIGFAIPINTVKPIIEKLKNDGKFEEAEIGIFAYDKDVIPYLNNGIKFENGIYVESILYNSQAQKAGLKEGDIITKVDEKIINKMNELREYIYTKKPGDQVKLSVLRNKKRIDLIINLVKK